MASGHKGAIWARTMRSIFLTVGGGGDSRVGNGGSGHVSTGVGDGDGGGGDSHVGNGGSGHVSIRVGDSEGEGEVEVVALVMTLTTHIRAIMVMH